MQVTGLFIYPVKGLRGTEVTSFEMTSRGPRFDRGWLLVDPTNKFMTQRTMPKLAQLQPTIRDGVMTVQGVDLADVLTVPFEADGGRRTVTVWKDTFEAIDCGDDAANWFSRVIGSACRLVRTAPDVHRRLDPKYVSDREAETGFADAYPVLVVNEASLTDLNSRLTQPVPMNRFRPNVVVRGPAAWAEDTWRQVRLGRLEFDAVKPCARCVVITTDQLSGERPAGVEPMRTLASYRTMPQLGAIFGMNLVPRASSGTLHVGDEVTPIAVETK